MPLESYNVRTRIIRPVQRDPERQASMRKILWRAAVIVPLLAALVIVPLKTDLFRSRVETTNLNPLVSAEFEQNKKAVDEDVKSEQLKAGENVLPVTEEQPVEEIVAPPVVEANSYFLITGSFKSEQNAMSQADVLKSQGFNPEIVVAPNGFYRVCAMACSDINTALTKKDSIAGQFPGAWVSKKK
jgi:cell division protein FtsL